MRDVCKPQVCHDFKALTAFSLINEQNEWAIPRCLQWLPLCSEAAELADFSELIGPLSSTANRKPWKHYICKGNHLKVNLVSWFYCLLVWSCLESVLCSSSVHMREFLHVDSRCFIHYAACTLTACWHVMMYPPSAGSCLMKKQAVSDNNACASAPVYMRVCLDCIQMDLLRSSL